ncbi:MAG: membrane protein insertion efficiency factor YidD [Beijerinckiaceae bacterium]|nr:MAG: membrane protein insertion efficiency factor YidD [Beijerinckiaceae bacterium]
MPDLGLLSRRAAHYLIRAYQLSFSLLLGRQCRYLPSCSTYTDEAIARHGLGPGAVMGLARICRCHPWGNHGFDPVPEHLPAGSSWLRPWRYGDWRGPLHCEDIAVRPAPIRGSREDNVSKTRK